MKRIIAAAAAAVAVIGLLGVSPLAAAGSDNAPQNSPGAHVHHRHHPDGTCHELGAPAMGGPSEGDPQNGIHNAAIKEDASGEHGHDDNIHHGTCETGQH